MAWCIKRAFCTLQLQTTFTRDIMTSPLNNSTYAPTQFHVIFSNIALGNLNSLSKKQTDHALQVDNLTETGPSPLRGLDLTRF